VFALGFNAFESYGFALPLSMGPFTEPVFINSLKSEFELSPAESSGVFELAERCLFVEILCALGKIRFLCASKQTPDARVRLSTNRPFCSREPSGA